MRSEDHRAVLPGERIVTHILHFCRYLKRQGLRITTGRILDVASALRAIEVTHKQDFYLALRCCLVASREDIAIFDQAFPLFWEFTEDEFRSPLPVGQEGLDTAITVQTVGLRSEGVNGSQWSPHETLGRRDVNTLSVEESREINRLIREVAKRIATRESRRRKPARRGERVHFRTALRRSQKYGMDLIDLAWEKRKKRKTHVVLLCDVSGSMDCYSQFLIQFMFGLQKELKNSRTAVFSTRLTNVSNILRRKSVEAALGEISRHVLDWSGGTNIGGALAAFNRTLGKSCVRSSTVIIIVSDGYDRGDTTVLAKEMTALRRRCHKLIWINPLLGTVGYSPVAEGMRTALPYVDHFLPAHDLESLRGVSRVLQGTPATSVRSSSVLAKLKTPGPSLSR